MRKWLTIALVGALGLCACQQSVPSPGRTQTLASPNTTTPEAGIAPRISSPAGGEIVAIIKGSGITRDQLAQPVFEAFGLRFLMHMAKLELAVDKARELAVAVTPEDIAREREMTLDAWFREWVRADDLKGTDAEKAEFRRQKYCAIPAPVS